MQKKGWIRVLVPALGDILMPCNMEALSLHLPPVKLHVYCVSVHPSHLSPGWVDSQSTFPQVLTVCLFFTLRPG